MIDTNKCKNRQELNDAMQYEHLKNMLSWNKAFLENCKYEHAAIDERAETLKQKIAQIEEEIDIYDKRYPDKPWEVDIKDDCKLY